MKSLFTLLLSLIFAGVMTAQGECDGVDAGTVAFSSGTDNITLLVDGIPDIVSFTTTADVNSNDFSFTYVITQANGTVLSIPSGDTVDFEAAGPGVCRVYGLAYTGELTIEPGDFIGGLLENFSTGCADLSDNNVLAIRLDNQSIDQTFYASSNTSEEIGVYNTIVDLNEQIATSTFASGGMDADGIFYDEDSDVLYQLNRTDNVVNAYADAMATLRAGGTPAITATSTSDFSNGREIAFFRGKLIVAQDGNDDNGGNKLVVYDASGDAITLNKSLDIDINLWGIVLNGSNLFAIEDNSSNVVEIKNIFSQSGSITAMNKVAVEGLVRTHGITYVPEVDMMLLTDVGDPGDDRDGAIIRIKKYGTASADGMISADEQIRVGGGSSLLGNPVDITYDKKDNRVYVAERARNGGMILCFKLPAITGPIAPTYKQLFPGASAIHFPGIEVDACDDISGGSVSLLGGATEATIIVDGNPDFLSFNSSVNSDNSSFTYVVTDNDGKILGIPPGNTVDFDPAGLGLCRVYGVSYIGELMIAPDDDFFADDIVISDICAEVSSNFISVNRIEGMPSDVRFYTSSNTSGMVGVFNVLADGNVTMNSFDSQAEDADGIFYDESNDVLYQLNRVDNVVNAYTGVEAAVANGTMPTLSATSSSDFTNGREITVSGGKLVVAQDETDENGRNRLYVYDASASAITLDKVFDVDINLWGIQAVGSTLYAVEDNSSNVATYENFFSNEEGFVEPSSKTIIAGLVRTHGIHYVSDVDMMLLTDVGDAGDKGDGAIIRIKKWSDASEDGMVSPSEQIRVRGGSSLLGNPVDIAYDQNTKVVYVAERARNGGMILGYKLPILTGGIAPIYAKSMDGASSIHFPGTGESTCELVDGGMVALEAGGTSTTIIIDGIADNISFTSDVVPSGFSFTYVVTDASGTILGIPPGNTVDFDPAGEGLCRVYGLSYAGSLNIAMGDDLFEDGLQISDDCFDLSDNSLTINRIAPGTSDLQVFSSSNTTGEITVLSILGFQEIASQSFSGNAMDADGIYYDDVNDVLYQLNRDNNVIDVYGSVKESLANGMVPQVIASSTSDFANGREIAVIDGKLVVAQDGNDNNDGNKLVVYDITPTSVTYDKEYTVDINLWGIFATGNTLFAVEDNSSNVAVYSDFFNTPAGELNPTNLVMIEDMVRTHGIAYDFHDDIMMLTDVGEASDDNDGALVVIRNWTELSADGVITTEEQARAFAGADQLGNPVDITLDRPGKMVYVAERAHEGGMLLGFKLPKLSGGIAPAWEMRVPGSSAVHLPGLEVGICEIANGGVISLASGDDEATIFIDGRPDEISFATTVPDEPVGFNFTYVVTDQDGKILGIPPGNTVDFESAGTGTCFVYGLSYLGELMIATDDNLLEVEEFSTDCSDLSDNRLTINRIEPVAPEAQLFASSNTASQVGVFEILDNNAKVVSFFDVMNIDADGIYYDADSDVLYQLNRTDNVINAYGDASSAVLAGNAPALTATSTSDFANGREIAWMDGKLVVAQDANDTNGGNKFFIYDASSSAITLDKMYDADINLWGIHANGSTLFAIQDNSSNVAVYNNFLGNAAGAVVPDALVTVENLERTHGITYDAAADKMILTDVGEASEAEDGALVLIENWSVAAANDMVSADEQLRVAGDTTLLGNPVDVAYDAARETIYVAERANNGGRILGYTKSDLAAGEFKPDFIYNFAGASAVHISGSTSALKNTAAAERSVDAVVTNLFPSPASERINISLESNENMSTRIQIYDVTGNMVHSELVSLVKGENMIKVTVSDLTSGFHFVSIPSIDYSEKFLKIK